MKATTKIIAGVGVITAVGVILYLRKRHKTNLLNEEKAREVAEQGYETAHDVLFPKRGRRIKKFRYNQG